MRARTEAGLSHLVLAVRVSASLPRNLTEQSIRVALDLDGGRGDSLDDFLHRVMTPDADSPSR